MICTSKSSPTTTLIDQIPTEEERMEKYEKPMTELIEMPDVDIVTGSQCELDSEHECGMDS